MFATFIDIGFDEIATMTAYTADLLGDLNPLLLIIGGVGLGLIVFWAIVHAFR